MFRVAIFRNELHIPYLLVSGLSKLRRTFHENLCNNQTLKLVKGIPLSSE